MQVSAATLPTERANDAGNLNAITNTVVSADGTPIGYHQLGSGPTLLVLHGAMRMSQHYLTLATALADTFTVVLPDRRGRGLSGAYPTKHSIETELADLEAVLAATNATLLFGHSAGGLIALEAASRRTFARVAAYEPGSSIKHSFPTAWMPRFEETLARGDSGGAMALFVHTLQGGLIGRMPLWLLTALFRKLLNSEAGAELTSLLPTALPDIRLLVGLDSTYQRYGAITAETLILHGGNGMPCLKPVIPMLASVIPHATRIELPKLDHNAPDMSAPLLIAGLLRDFFTR